ncbi:hypothetical protein [Sulfurisphaera ohwakuensis]|uniref:hypothetical protein n=1 Tax=Sulfurisphaera ohwakuensis TaxID=69656 RepID=UPI0036F372A6
MIKTKYKNEGIKLVSLLTLIFLLCPQTLVSFPTLSNHSEPIFQNATTQQFFQNYMQLDLQFWLSHANYGQVSGQSSGNVVFTQSGIPNGNKWVVRIFSYGEFTQFNQTTKVKYYESKIYKQVMRKTT